MGVFIMLAAMIGSTTPKPVSRRSMRIAKAGGIRTSKTRDYRRAVRNSVRGWDDWDDCCVDYLLKQEDKVRASQLNLDEALSMLTDSVLDNTFFPVPSYNNYALEWEQDRLIEDIEDDALYKYKRYCC